MVIVAFMELMPGLFLFTSSPERQTELSDGWRDGWCNTTAQHVHDLRVCVAPTVLYLLTLALH